MPKICFVESMTYSVLNPKSSRSPGGEGVQHALLSREFAKQGWDVSVVCLDVGQPDGEEIDGVRVWKTYQSNAGVPGLRFFYPRLHGLRRALKKADADIYFQSCAGLHTGVVAQFAQSRGRKMVFRIAHDTDCIPGQQLINNFRDRWLYEYGLNRTHLISAQSAVQAQALQTNYGLQSSIVNMVVEHPDENQTVEKDIDVLWVNNLREFKRPDIVADIAQQMPNVNFVMIGGAMAGFEDLHQDLRRAAEALPNLDYVGSLPYAKVNSYFVRSKLFLNTSDSEGFPNSYLQAWIRGVPVISYFDPDGLIASEEIGAAVATQKDFCAPIEELLGSRDKRNEIGARARDFAVKNYSPTAIVQHYQDLFDSELGLKISDG
ncbi:MAG: glycosyltransferase family 4 protein [Woeseiaceae bacterium]